MKNTAKKALKWVLFLYLGSCMAMMFYFNWEYVRNEGFMRWFLFGEITSTFKSLAWPFWLKDAHQFSNSWNQEEMENAVHFSNALKLASKAASVLDGLDNADADVLILANLLQIQIKKNELIEIKLVRDDFLEKALPGLSKPYRELFQKGLELEIKELEDKTHQPAGGFYLYKQWFDWFRENGKLMKFPPSNGEIGKVPEPILKIVEDLAEASAILGMCIANPEFSKVPNEKGIRLQVLWGGLDRLALDVANRYGAGEIVSKFELKRNLFYGDDKIREISKNKYKICGNNLLGDMEKWIGATQINVHSYLAN